MSQRIPNFVDYGFSHAIAMETSISAAMVLNRIIWSINSHREKPEKYKETYFFGGHWWMDDTYLNLTAHFEGLISIDHIRDVVRKLEKRNLLVSCKPNAAKRDHTKWYRLNIEEYLAAHKIPDTGKIPASDTGKIPASDTGKIPASEKTENSNEDATANVAIDTGKIPASSLSNSPNSLTNSLMSVKTDIPKKSIAKKPRVRDWLGDDEFAKVFENLCKVPTMKRAFHREKFRECLQKICTDFVIDAAKLTELAEGWAEYYNKPTAPQCTNPMRRFENWIKNHFKWGKDKNDGYQTSRPVERMGQQGYAPIDDDLMARINEIPA